MLCWREFLGILILFDIGWISSAPMLCHLPDSYNKGHCVPARECSSINLSANVISPDVFEDLTKRQESCSAFGKNLICCELTKYESSMKPITMMSSTSTTTAPVTTVSIKPATTKATTTTSKIEITTEAQKVPEHSIGEKSNVDITEHENYKLFDQKECGKSFLKRVANGDDAEVLEFPWIVRLKYQKGPKSYYGCAGTLISEFYVLTAAHCVVNTPKLIRITLGEYNETSDKDCNEDMLCADPVQDVEIATTAAHPEYNPLKLINDIALIRLSKPAKLKQNNINTICLPLDDVSSKKLGPNYQVIGWGATENSTAYPILQKAYVPPVNLSECENKLSAFKNFNKNLGDNQLCAGGQDHVDACKGDSGGPLQAPAKVNKMPRYVQFGIVSYGVKTCGEGNYPGVYTNVKNYLHWILDNMF